MKPVIITRIGVGSLGKLIGSANGIVALIFGVIAAVVSTVTVVTNGDYGIFQDILIAIGITLAYIILFPLIAFGFGWLYGAVVGLVWNVFLGASKGLEIELTEKK